jgi:serine phosphatase RsbU (regulator of sigma subunit)
MRLLGTLRGLSPQEIVEAVEQAAVEIQDGQPRDDIALVAFAIDAEPAVPLSTS